MTLLMWDPNAACSAERVGWLLKHIMKEGTLPADLKCLKAALVLVPRIEQVMLHPSFHFHYGSPFALQAAGKLMSLANLNYAVHQRTYQDLIKLEPTAT